MNLHCQAHLGDCLWTCMMLRRVGGAHTLYCNEAYVPELRELMADTGHFIRPMHQWDGRGINTWIGDTQFNNVGCVWRGQRDIIGYAMGYLNLIALQIAGKEAFASRRDMLWESPAIKPDNVRECDVMFVNARPLSGQCPHYNDDAMSALIELTRTTRNAVRTNRDGHHLGTLADVARISTRARIIVAVATGPMWVTWNTCNELTPRIILMDPEFVDFGTKGIVRHVGTVAEATNALCELL